MMSVEAEHPGVPQLPGRGGRGLPGGDCELPGAVTVCRREMGCRVKQVETCLEETLASLVILSCQD